MLYNIWLWLKTNDNASALGTAVSMCSTVLAFIAALFGAGAYLKAREQVLLAKGEAKKANEIAEEERQRFKAAESRRAEEQVVEQKRRRAEEAALRAEPDAVEYVATKVHTPTGIEDQWSISFTNKGATPAVDLGVYDGKTLLHHIRVLAPAQRTAFIVPDFGIFTEHTVLVIYTSTFGTQWVYELEASTGDLRFRYAGHAEQQSILCDIE